jgi:hypothetical protein
METDSEVNKTQIFKIANNLARLKINSLLIKTLTKTHNNNKILDLMMSQSKVILLELLRLKTVFLFVMSLELK